MDMNAHHASLKQTLKGIESKLAFLGPGTHHTAQQAEEFKKLTAVKQNILQQIQASIQTTVSQQQVIASATTGTSQSTNTNTSHVSSPSVTLPMATPPQKPSHTQVVLTKPKPPTPVFVPQPNVKAETKILNKQRLQDLVKEIDPTEQLDDDVEEMLISITDDFIENVVSASCQLARHRKSNTLEVKDVKLHLEKHWNITIPGYGSDEVRSYKKPVTSDAHKQRLALIRKAMKK